MARWLAMLQHHSCYAAVFCIVNCCLFAPLRAPALDRWDNAFSARIETHGAVVTCPSFWVLPRISRLISKTIQHHSYQNVQRTAGLYGVIVGEAIATHLDRCLSHLAVTHRGGDGGLSAVEASNHDKPRTFVRCNCCYQEYLR
jgi:hypothetical protein